jgi:RHS repeat-associated protein
MKRDSEAPAKRYRYTGMERDEESGLSYHTARYYLSWVGRWASCDPIGVLGGLDRYMYSSCDPVGRIDLHGTQESKPDKSETSRVKNRPNVKTDAGVSSGKHPGQLDGGSAAVAIVLPDAKTDEELRRTSLLVFQTAKDGTPEMRTMAAEPATGPWGKTVLVGDFDDILTKTRDRASDQKVAALGLLVHGDSGGQFKIGETKFDATNLPTEKLKELANYLTSDAKVYLFGCISGRDKDGSILLKEMSKSLPGRLIVGFNTLNDIELTNVRKEGPLFNKRSIGDPVIKAEPLGTWNKPDSIEQARRDPEKWRQGRSLANEQAPQAKVARDGQIIKWPQDENAEKHDAKMGSTPLTKPRKKN